MATTQKTTLQIEGMTCANCALGITRTLEKNGGKDVSVNFSTGEALFNLPESKKLPEIITSIQSLGYKVIEDAEANKSQEGLSALEKKFYFTLLFTVPLFSHMFLPIKFLHNPIVQLILCIPVFVVGCLYFGKSAWGSLKSGVPNMDVLIMIGSSSAFIYSLTGTILYYGTPYVHNFLFYETTATIISLVLLGNVLEHKSVHQTTTAIRELSKLQETKALKVVQQGEHEQLVEVDFKQIKKGDVLQINTGDRIPVDGIIIQGTASIDESAMTGESIPVEKNNKDTATGGTIIVEGNIRMRAERVGKETTMSQIIELVKNAQLNKPAIQKVGDKVSAIFVPIVLAISILTFSLSYFFFDITAQKAIMNSIAVLVISCPCAMGLATPTALMAGIGRAAKNGILIKGGNTLETFADIKNIVFDKTGTLTTGNFTIKKIHLFNNANEEEVKAILLKLEAGSSHPIAKSILSNLKTNFKGDVTLRVNEEKGIGVSATASDGNFYQLGSKKIIQAAEHDKLHDIYLLKNKSILAAIDIEDELKTGVATAIKEIEAQGITTILLSGDSAAKCKVIAQEVGIQKIYSEQMPDQKLAIIKQLSSEASTAMVGDGINDAPALAQATVGISVGNASQVAIQSAQIILLNNKSLSQLVLAHQLSKHTLLTIKQNLFWAFFYNVVAIPIAAFGFLNPMVGALAMAFSDVIVIGNSIRLKYKKIA